MRRRCCCDRIINNCDEFWTWFNSAGLTQADVSQTAFLNTTTCGVGGDCSPLTNDFILSSAEACCRSGALASFGIQPALMTSCNGVDIEIDCITVLVLCSPNVTPGVDEVSLGLTWGLNGTDCNGIADRVFNTPFSVSDFLAGDFVPRVNSEHCQLSAASYALS